MSSRLETNEQFEQLYRDYISAVNNVRKPTDTHLAPFLADTVIHNDRKLDLKGYTSLIDGISEFRILEIVCDSGKAIVAARLEIGYSDGWTKYEHVFYEWDRDAKVILKVWSMVEEPPREQ